NRSGNPIAGGQKSHATLGARTTCGAIGFACHSLLAINGRRLAAVVGISGHRLVSRRVRVCPAADSELVPSPTTPHGRCLGATGRRSAVARTHGEAASFASGRSRAAIDA